MKSKAFKDSGNDMHIKPCCTALTMLNDNRFLLFDVSFLINTFVCGFYCIACR